MQKTVSEKKQTVRSLFLHIYSGKIVMSPVILGINRIESKCND